MGRAWLQSVAVALATTSPVRETVRVPGDVDADVHELHDAPDVPERPARTSPARTVEPSTGEADQSIHEPVAGSRSGDAARRYSAA